MSGNGGACLNLFDNTPISKYVLWKFGLLAQILFGHRQDEWGRTKRNEA